MMMMMMLKNGRMMIIMRVRKGIATVMELLGSSMRQKIRMMKRMMARI